VREGLGDCTTFGQISSMFYEGRAPPLARYNINSPEISGKRNSIPFIDFRKRAHTVHSNTVHIYVLTDTNRRKRAVADDERIAERKYDCLDSSVSATASSDAGQVGGCHERASST